LSARLDDPEFFARLTEAVIELHDPRSIDALVGVLGTGSTRTPIALADFWELAAPKVLAVAEASDNAFQVDHALIALRCMVEHIREHPLSDETLETVANLAEQRLTDPQLLASNGVILMKAIDLAVALGDPRLRKLVESIASDADAIRSRGVRGPDLVERVQRHSADRLEGIHARPSCD